MIHCRLNGDAWGTGGVSAAWYLRLGLGVRPGAASRGTTLVQTQPELCRVCRIVRVLTRRCPVQEPTRQAAGRTRSALFTIGYQQHSLDSLVQSLSENGIQVLMDVRQNASSRKAGFSKGKLGDAITGAGITYVHRPDLGTPSSIRAIYRRSGNVSA